MKTSIKIGFLFHIQYLQEQITLLRVFRGVILSSPMFVKRQDQKHSKVCLNHVFYSKYSKSAGANHSPEHFQESHFKPAYVFQKARPETLNKTVHRSNHSYTQGFNRSSRPQVCQLVYRPLLPTTGVNGS